MSILDSDKSFNFSTPDRELIASLKDDNQSAFKCLYQRYSSGLYEKLLRMIKDPGIADELLQDVFVKVWTKRFQLDIEKSFPAWINKIAQNAVYDHFRELANNQKKQAQLILIYESMYDLTEDFLFHEERRALLDKAVSQLSPQRKQIFELCRLQGKSYKDVADLLNISVSTVSNQLVSASKQVKHYIFYNNKEFLLFVIAYCLK